MSMNELFHEFAAEIKSARNHEELNDHKQSHRAILNAANMALGLKAKHLAAELLTVDLLLNKKNKQPARQNIISFDQNLTDIANFLDQEEN